MVIILYIDVSMSMTSCLCETANSLKVRMVSPNFLYSLGPTWHTSFRTICQQGRLTWEWEHRLRPESRPEECQWTSCPRVPSGQKEMPSQLMGKEKNGERPTIKFYIRLIMFKSGTTDWHFCCCFSTKVSQRKYRKYISHN